MKIHHELKARDNRPPLALAIGFFDGLHRGHQALLDSLQPYAQNGVRLAALSFHRHPLQFLRPQEAPQLLVPLEERVNLLAAAGVEELYLLDFNEQIANCEARTFLEEMLIGHLCVKAVAVGKSFRFGAQRRGDAELAKDIFSQHGVAFTAVEHVIDGNESISSTRIRTQLMAGNLAEVDRLLGRSYRLSGVVRLGAGRGHDLGFPTANLTIDRECALPPDGVYTASAYYAGITYRALVSIGTNPTFGEMPRTIEVWIQNFTDTIYGHELRIDTIRFIRPQQRFSGVDALMTQMNRDVQALD